MKKVLIVYLTIIIVLILSLTVAYADNYYVSNSGDDNNSGKSPMNPWKTVYKVNNYSFKPGDVIHFKRGDVWRDQLIPVSGVEGGYVKYTSYGIGKKPAFIGSVDRSKPDNWKHDYGNIWELPISQNYDYAVPTVPIEKLFFWKEKGDSISSQIVDNGMGHRVMEIKSYASGKMSENVQLSIEDLKVKEGRNYIFSFRAKCSKNFTLSNTKLMKGVSPWSDLFTLSTDNSLNISTYWQEYKIYYQVNTDEDNARIALLLGTSLPKGSEFAIDSIRFYEASTSEIYHDVGNIIFNNGESCGKKVFLESDLKKQGDFLYYPKTYSIKIYSM